MDVAEFLTPIELQKREGLKLVKPRVYEKFQGFNGKIERGESIAIIRLEYSYLCNFRCEHCCVSEFMIEEQGPEKRRHMNLDDVKELSRQADEMGLARFVITGGEPLTYPDFDKIVEAIDPSKHYVITDSNGWFLDAERAKHLKSIGVDKVQVSLDSFYPEEHDLFRRKIGSHARVMKAIDNCLNEGLNFILSTVLLRGRAKTEEFLKICELAKEKGIGLYISYAKPVGSYLGNFDAIITKEDADVVRELEKEYPVFTHMTPSYGLYQGCITMKGIVTVTSSGEVEPCPYIHVSMGNIFEEPFKNIIERGMNIKQYGEHRPDCIIGENREFIDLVTEKTKEHLAAGKQLPVSWKQVFTEKDFMDVPKI